MSMLLPGEVIRIFDRYTRPPKPKWHICVCQHYGLFLRINSNPLWPPHFALYQSESPWLDHDSYVELTRLYEFRKPEVDAALSEPPNPIGTLSRFTREKLIEAAELAPTLTEEQKGYIASRLLDDELREGEIWDDI